MALTENTGYTVVWKYSNRFMSFVSLVSAFQLIIADLMLGTYVRVERAVEAGDSISGVCFAGKGNRENVCAYNCKYYRSDNPINGTRFKTLRICFVNVIEGCSPNPESTLEAVPSPCPRARIFWR